MTNIFGLDGMNIETSDRGKKEAIDVKCPKLFLTPENLRQNLLVELFFEEDNVETEAREINSFIFNYTREKESVKI